MATRSCFLSCAVRMMEPFAKQSVAWRADFFACWATFAIVPKLGAHNQTFRWLGLTILPLPECARRRNSVALTYHRERRLFSALFHYVRAIVARHPSSADRCNLGILCTDASQASASSGCCDSSEASAVGSTSDADSIQLALNMVIVFAHAAVFANDFSAGSVGSDASGLASTPRAPSRKCAKPCSVKELRQKVNHIVTHLSRDPSAAASRHFSACRQCIDEMFNLRVVAIAAFILHNCCNARNECIANPQLKTTWNTERVRRFNHELRRAALAALGAVIAEASAVATNVFTGCSVSLSALYLAVAWLKTKALPAHWRRELASAITSARAVVRAAAHRARAPQCERREGMVLEAAADSSLEVEREFSGFLGLFPGARSIRAGQGSGEGGGEAAVTEIESWLLLQRLANSLDELVLAGHYVVPVWQNRELDAGDKKAAQSDIASTEEDSDSGEDMPACQSSANAVDTDSILTVSSRDETDIEFITEATQSSNVAAAAVASVCDSSANVSMPIGRGMVEPGIRGGAGGCSSQGVKSSSSWWREGGAMSERFDYP